MTNANRQRVTSSETDSLQASRDATASPARASAAPLAADVDPYREAVIQLFVRRAPIGFAVFLACVGISATFEMLRFPGRREWMVGFAVGFAVVSAIFHVLIKRTPRRGVELMIVAVNLIGALINVYHVIVGGSVAMCVLVLTALIGVSTIIFPWGARAQALSCFGALVSYPTHLALGEVDGLMWSAGGTYLIVLVLSTVAAASLFDRHLRTDLRLQSALGEREARLQSYFDLSMVGTAILDSRGRVVEMNDELCRMFGYSRRDFTVLPFETLMEPDARDTALRLVREALAGAPSQRREMRCRRGSGEPMDAILYVRGLPGPGGAIDHAMALVQDLSEQKRADAERERYLSAVEAARGEAEQASRAKDVFLAMVSHELRTPLAPVITWAQMLRRGRLTGDKAAAALEGIERATRTQARLVDDLLTASQIASGTWSIEVRPVELTKMLASAIELLQPVAEAQGVTLETSIPASSIGVAGDEQRLLQITSNLISNALKFTPQGGRVTVSLSTDGGLAQLAVSDTGEGIRADFLPHVFEPFRQADSTGERRQGGLGLGLAIVRALVERHGGTVRAESEGSGRGATFIVELPLQSD